MKTFSQFAEELTAYGQLRYGSTPATASNRSVSSAVDKALANIGTSQSASETKGKSGVTGSGYVRYSGSVGSSPSQQSGSSQSSGSTSPKNTSMGKPEFKKPEFKKPEVKIGFSK